MKAYEVDKSERVLFAFTHPDDELAATAFMGRLLAQGVPIHVSWSHSTPVREAESRAALGSIGVAQEDMTFFDAADGHVIDALGDLRAKLRVAIKKFEPTRIVTHAFEQGHIDHDATNLLVNLCFDGPVFEAPFYHTYMTKMPRLYRFSTLAGEEKIVLTPDERKTKRRLVAMFPSQTVRRNVVVYELAHAVTLRRPPLFQFERMRLQTHKDFLKPNHPRSVALRLEQCKTWKRWVEGAKRFL